MVAPDQHLLALGQYELIAAYVVLAALLLSIAIWNRLGWWIKASGIVVTAVFFFVSFYAVKNMLGWPDVGRAAGPLRDPVRAHPGTRRGDARRGARSTSGR